MMQVTLNSPYYPDYTAGSVLDIDYDILLHSGITHIVFDLDDTLVRRSHDDISPEYIALVQSLADKGFRILIGTNTRRNLPS